MASLARLSPARLVTRILEHPDLVPVVQALEPRVLRRLVEHVGLEDAGEIVALATSAQIERIFDEDLWKSAVPGRDEAFDAKRFALWLEILLEAGEEQAVEKVAEMDEDLLALGLSRLVLVIDIDELALTMSEDHSDETELLEKALESCLGEELEEFRVVSKDPASWDAILTLLVGLDKNHHALLRRVLERCCAASSEYIEDNGGLYDVLSSDEMLESDVGFEREQRREREGYVAPSQAAAFLRLAKITPLDEIVASKAPDPVTKAQFRVEPAGARPPVGPKVEEFLRELRAAGVLPKRERPALVAPGWSAASLLGRAMAWLREADRGVFDLRQGELAYLVNLLIAVCGADERLLRPVEAMTAVAALCDLGLARLSGPTQTDARLRAIVEGDGLVKAFRVGWHLVDDEAWTAAGLRATAARAFDLARHSGQSGA